MPEEFDPAWEYAVVDPEIADVFDSVPPGFSRLGIEDRRLDRAGVSPGFRFGRGNPDTFVCRRRRGSDFIPDAGVPPRVCPGCGRLFAPDRESRVHCSDRCYRRPGRPRVFPDTACDTCGALFKPGRGGRRFCSRACAAPHGGLRADESGDGLIAEMLVAGFRHRDIAVKLGISVVTVKKRRRSLGVAPRPTGNHSRRKSMSEENGQPLRDIGVVARRTPRMSLEDARATILTGVSFGDVLPQIDHADEEALRDWFCRSDEVTMNRRAAYLPAARPQQAYPNGEFCSCGGLIVQDGKCRKCTSCPYSEGSCS